VERIARYEPLACCNLLASSRLELPQKKKAALPLKPATIALKIGHLAFQVLFIFDQIPGEMIQFDGSYFSDGLVKNRLLVNFMC